MPLTSRRHALALHLAVALFAIAAAAQAPPPRPDFALAGSTAPLPDDVAARVAAVRADAIGADIALLASPALGGRGLGTPGLDAAIEYAATSLALAGVPPLAVGDGPLTRSVYFQTVPLREISGYGGSVTITRTEGEERSRRSFASGVDCLLPAILPGTTSGAAVFAAYGIRDDKLGRDDYRDLDVRGKAVVVLSGVPDGPGWDAPEARKRWAGDPDDPAYRAKVAVARSLGATLVLAVEGAGWAKALAAKDAVLDRFFVAADAAVADEDGPPLVRVSPAVGAWLAVGPERAPGALAGISAAVETHGVERRLASRNVLACLPGRDPELRAEAVVIGAHLDHLGMAGGVLHPGADDNASGTAALLEIARVVAASPQRTKRSLVLAFWTGEEEGHLGSELYLREPRWPLARTVAYLNLDMIGHPWLESEIADLVRSSGMPDGDAFLTGVVPADFAEPGVADFAPDLAAVLLRVGPALGLAVHLDRTDGRHGGSDYRGFARHDVPFVRFFGDFFPEYHEPGDTPDRVDPAQVRKLARYCLATALTLADR